MSDDELIELLAKFACHISPTLDVDNADDLEAAKRLAKEFLEAEFTDT